MSYLGLWVRFGTKIEVPLSSGQWISPEIAIPNGCVHRMLNDILWVKICPLSHNLLAQTSSVLVAANAITGKSKSPGLFIPWLNIETF